MLVRELLTKRRRALLKYISHSLLAAKSVAKFCEYTTIIRSIKILGIGLGKVCVWDDFHNKKQQAFHAVSIEFSRSLR